MSKLDRKTILVTGAAGFIGASLCKRLLASRQYQIIGYDNLCDYYDVNLKRERLAMLQGADAEGRFQFVHADLCSRAALEQVFRQCQPTIVVNLAAQAGVRYSIDHPRTYVETNILGFFNVLELCRQFGVEHLVYASSSSVYGNASTAPFSEAEACNEPVSLYAATKKSDELLAHSYASLFGISCTGLRFFTVYGPMGRPDMAYFSFAERMVAGEEIPVFNRGEMLRDFTYVEDVVGGIERVIDRGFVTIGEAGTTANVFNIGHGNPVTLMEFIQELENALRAEGLIAGDVRYKFLPMQQGDVHKTYADTTALRQAYGYTADTTLAQGMREFAHWFAHRKHRTSM